MANTFTNLVKSAYKALDVVSRELVGFVNSVTLDADAAAVPVGQTLYSFETPAVTSTTITPAVTPPDDGDQIIGSQPITITTLKRVPFRWTGEESVAINTGAGYQAVRQGQIAQALRTLCNEMEAATWAEAYQSASRAFGTAGTTPFATTLEDAAQIRKILDDNGADGARSLILNTAAGLNLRKQTQLTKVNESGTTMTLRDGELLDLFGLSIKESAAPTVVTKGTGASYTTTAAGFPVGTTSIPLITGTGTVLAGDRVTFAGDTNIYVVQTGVAAPGTIVIGGPGLRVAIPAVATAMTIGNNATPNVAFSQTAIILAARTPYVPDGDLTINEEIITDPRSGLSFRLAQYANYYRTQFEVSAAWGVAGIKPAHTAVLLG